ncbi:MAG TPA: pirin-like C-terminal cupin domain-containing protein, partial [Bdellovibrionales bacterium]|nr:pirin-like C-terminal cupin domain-containing protein [Bdellovibrionales bacterium]
GLRVDVIAGDYEGVAALTPPPNSWAAESANEVTILLIRLGDGGEFRLPRAKGQVNRTLYFFEGRELSLNGVKVADRTGYHLEAQSELELKGGAGGAQLLLLQAKPIGEPTFQHGPFVMNSRDDIIRTIQDYQRTQFGGWPWARHDMIHGPTIERFAKYPDGRVEKPKV